MHWKQVSSVQLLQELHYTLGLFNPDILLGKGFFLAIVFPPPHFQQLILNTDETETETDHIKHPDANFLLYSTFLKAKVEVC